MAQAHNDIDWEQLHELSGNDPAFEQELLQLFLQDSQEQLAHLESAWSSRDLTEVRQIAHYIKGASANVGAVTLSGLAAQIEVAARNQQPEPIPQALASLSQGLERLRHSLGS